MAVSDPKTGETFLKVVYFGPKGSGKTANIQSLYKQCSNQMATKLFEHQGIKSDFEGFDFLPLSLPSVRAEGLVDRKYRLHVFALNLEEVSELTRSLVLQDLDCAICVLNSKAEKLEFNLNYVENLKSKLGETPLVVQFSGRDEINALPIPVLKKAFENYLVTEENGIEALPTKDMGVLETLSLAAAFSVQGNHNMQEILQ